MLFKTLNLLRILIAEDRFITKRCDRNCLLLQLG